MGKMVGAKITHCIMRETVDRAPAKIGRVS